MKLWLKSLLALLGSGGIVAGSVGGVFIYSKTSASKGEGHTSFRTLDNNMDAFNDIAKYKITIRDLKDSKKVLANYDFKTDTIAGKKAQDWIEEYFAASKRVPPLFIEAGPILFTNFYTDVILPKEFAKFVAWFSKNVSWTPDISSISYYTIKRGVEKEGFTYTLGSYTAINGEKKVIKFIPDSFFQDFKVLKNLITPFSDYEFTKDEVKVLINKINVINSSKELQSNKEKLSIYSAEKLANGKYKVYMSLFGVNSKGSVLQNIDKKLYDIIENVSDIDIISDKNGIMELKERPALRLRSTSSVPWLELMRVSAGDKWKGISTTFLKYVSTHEYGHMETLSAAQRADGHPIQLGVSNNASSNIGAAPVDIDVLNNYLSARVPSIRAVRVRPELKYVPEIDEYRYDVYEDAVAKYNNDLIKYAKGELEFPPIEPLEKSYTNVAFEIRNLDNTWTLEDINKIFAGKIDIRDANYAPYSMKNLSIDDFWKQRLSVRFFSRNITDTELFAKKLNVPVSAIFVMNAFDNILPTLSPTTYVNYTGFPQARFPKITDNGIVWPEEHKSIFEDAVTKDGKHIFYQAKDFNELVNAYYAGVPVYKAWDNGDYLDYYLLNIDNIKRTDKEWVQIYDWLSKILDTLPRFYAIGNAITYGRAFDISEASGNYRWYIPSSSGIKPKVFFDDSDSYLEALRDITKTSSEKSPSGNELIRAASVTNGKDFLDYMLMNKTYTSKFFTGEEVDSDLLQDLSGSIAIEVVNGKRIFTSSAANLSLKIFGQDKTLSTHTIFSSQIGSHSSLEGYDPGNFQKYFNLFTNDAEISYLNIYDSSKNILKSNLSFDETDIQKWKDEVQRLGGKALDSDSDIAAYQGKVTELLIKKAQYLRLNTDYSKGLGNKKIYYDFKQFDQYLKYFTFSDFIDLLAPKISTANIQGKIKTSSIIANPDKKDRLWHFIAPENMGRFIDASAPEDYKNAFNIFVYYNFDIGLVDEPITNVDDFVNCILKVLKLADEYVDYKKGTDEYEDNKSKGYFTLIATFIPVETYKKLRDLTRDERIKFLKDYYNDLVVPYNGKMFELGTQSMLSFLSTEQYVKFGKEDYLQTAYDTNVVNFMRYHDEDKNLRQWLDNPTGNLTSASLQSAFSDYTYLYPEVLTRDWVQITYSMDNEESFYYVPELIKNSNEFLTGMDYYFDPHVFLDTEEFAVAFDNTNYLDGKAFSEYQGSSYATLYKNLVSGSHSNFLKGFDIADEEGNISNSSGYIEASGLYDLKYTKSGFAYDYWLRDSLKDKPLSDDSSLDPHWKLYNYDGTEVVDPKIRIRDFNGERVETRARAYWIFLLKSFGVGSQSLTAFWREPGRDAFTMWGYIKKDLASKIKYIKAQNVSTGETKYFGVKTDVDNLFYLRKQCDKSSKFTLRDEGYTSWTTSKFLTIGTWSDSDLANGKWQLSFVDSNHNPVNNPDGTNAFSLGDRNAITENGKNPSHAPIVIWNDFDNNKVYLEARNQFPV